MQLCQNLSLRTRRKRDISRMWTQHFKSILSDWLHDISHKRIWQHQIKVIWLYNNVRFDISTLIWFWYVFMISSETENERMQNHITEEYVNIIMRDKNSLWVSILQLILLFFTIWLQSTSRTNLKGKYYKWTCIIL